MKTTAIASALFLAGAAAAAVLVWDHDGGATFDDPGGAGHVGTEYRLVRALNVNGVTDVDKRQVLPLDLAGYDAVFVLCGFWPHDGRLSITEQNALAAYLAGGGNLYVEGTDVAARYGDTPLFVALGTGFIDDGRPMEDGNVNVAEGIGPWKGYRWDYFAYSRDRPDAYVDELAAAEGEVVVRSRRAGNQSNARVVRYAYEGDVPYRAVVSSLIFGALADGDWSRAELMALYLDFFGLGSDRAGARVRPASLGRVRALFR